MKKFILMTLVSLFAVCVYAQQESGTFAIQPKVGLNVSTCGTGTWKLGAVGGLEGTYQFTDRFGFSFGALFSMQGAKIKDEYLDDGFKSASITMGYINVPLLLHCYIVKGLAFKTGIQPGFNIYDRNKVKDFEGQSYSWNSNDGIKSVDLSIPVGLSYEMGGFVVDARYNIGVTNIADDGDAHNNVLQFTVGYKIPL